MSDEESLPISTVFEETVAVSGPPKAAQAEQRVRMPRSFEFARAVIGERRLSAWLVPVSDFVGQNFLAVTGALWGVMVLSALAGWLWPGVISYGLVAFVDYLASRELRRDTLLLRRMGAASHVRHFIRGVLLLAVFARIEQPAPALAWTAVLLTMILIQLVHVAGTAWLASKQPPLLYHPEGGQRASTLAFAKLYRQSSWTPKWLIAADIVVAVLLGVAATVGVGWAGTLLGACVIVIGLAAVVAGYALRLRRLGSEQSVAAITKEVTDELDVLAPEVVVYMSADAGQAQYILNQWVPTIEKLHQKAFIMVRESSHLESIRPTTLPVVYAPSTRHCEELTRSSVKLAFYLANAGKNVHLLREARLKHVFLNHGDSDKSTSANPVARVYDEVWVAGEAAVERYEAAGIHMPRKQYAIVGRPQVEQLKVGPLNTDGPKAILYAPTFEGYYEESNYSSLERMGPQMIARILAEYPGTRIIFKPHPASGVQRPGMVEARVAIVDMLAKHPGQHLYVGPESELTLYECFDMADAMISDISSVVTDYLYTERPLVTSNPRRLPRDLFFHTFPTQQASYIMEGVLENFNEVMDDVLGLDSQREQRVAVKKYVLGDHPNGPTATFVAESDRLTVEATEHAASIRNEFRVKS
ncbi:CDP-glycerol glycerophosphotransferase family protein [Micropruina sp.]|uniref:CDP-glycerol glycerophosphotransferase family protein n=1 Tax=Micropruina sp. TaxID=2737536 RepID=UPI0039E2D81A